MSFIILCKLTLFKLFSMDIGIAPNVGRDFIRVEIHGQPYLLPGYNNSAQLKPYNVRHAVIFIHGLLKNSKDAYYILIHDEKNKKTAIFAPQFITKKDRQHFLLPCNTLTWNLIRWDEGALTQKNKCVKQHISSFTAIDDMIYQLKNKYPHLKSITLIGFSSGAQFVQRYAYFHHAEFNIHYIVISPSSYLYFSSVRRDFKKTQCKNYNNYRYGLQNLPRDLSHDNLKMLTRHYLNENITYVIGADDNKRDILLDKSCGADAQGNTRLMRMKNYIWYLSTQYGLTHTNFLIISHAQHNQNQLLAV